MVEPASGRRAAEERVVLGEARQIFAAFDLDSAAVAAADAEVFELTPWL